MAFELFFLKQERTEAAETYVCPLYKWIEEGRPVRNSYGRDIIYFPGGIGLCVKNYSPYKKIYLLLNLYREDGVREKYIIPASYVEPFMEEFEKWQTDRLPLYPYDSHHGKILKATFSIIMHKDGNILPSIYEYKFASFSDFNRGMIEIDDFRESDYIKFNDFSPLSLHPATVQNAWTQANYPWEPLPVKVFFTRGNQEDRNHPRHEIHKLIDMVIERKKRDPWGYHYIHIAVFNFDNPYIMEHLLYAGQEGVEIECAGGWEQVSPLDFIESVSLLRKAGINVYGIVRNRPHDPSGGIGSMHTKIIIFDSQASMTASFNLDFHIWGGNWENAVFHYSPHIAILYENMYQAIKGGIYTSPIINPHSRFNSFYSFAEYKGHDGRSYRAQDIIIREIRKAKFSIVVAMFDMNYLTGLDEYGQTVDCISELIRASHRGVNIKIIFNGPKAEEGPLPEKWDKDYNRPLIEPLRRLLGEGIEIFRIYNHWDIFSPLHHKFAIFDNESVMTGSYNWYTVSPLSDEDMVLIRDRQVADRFMEEVHIMVETLRVKYG